MSGRQFCLSARVSPKSASPIAFVSYWASESAEPIDAGTCQKNSHWMDRDGRGDCPKKEAALTDDSDIRRAPSATKFLASIAFARLSPIAWWQRSPQV